MVNTAALVEQGVGWLGSCFKAWRGRFGLWQWVAACDCLNLIA